MSQDNPLLADDTLPAFSHIRPEHVAPTIEAILADYRAGIDALTAPGAAQDFASVMLTQERLEQRLARAWAPVSSLMPSTPFSAAWTPMASTLATSFASVATTSLPHLA